MTQVYYDANGNVIQPEQQQPPQGQQNYPQQYQQQGYAQQPQQQAGVPMDPNSVPEYLRQAQAQANANALDAGAGLGGPRLSIKGKQFRFIEGDTERDHPFGQPLHVVMLVADPAEGVAKNFYEGSYQEGQDVSPVCYSSDGITPDAGSEKPQSPTCAGCPHNKFGTARNQDGTLGKGKACRDFKRVFVIPYDQPHSNVYELRVPPTSFKNMQGYGRDLGRAGVPLHGAVTTLSFTSDTSPVLTFTFSGYVDGGAFTKINERLTGGELDSVLPSKNKTPAIVEGQQAVGQQSAGPALTHQPQEQPHDVNAVHAQAQPGATATQPQSQPVQSAPAPEVQAPAPAAPPAAPTQAPDPLGAPAGFRMTEKGQGARYEAFTGQGWNDQMLIEHGYMAPQQ